MERYCNKQDNQILALQDQVSKLETLQSSLLSKCFVKPCHGNDYPVADFYHVEATHPEATSTPNLYNNPTKCVEGYFTNFIPSDLSSNLSQFLNTCTDFGDNIENGHSVAMFGYPYNYHGSQHSGKATDIPEHIKEVIGLIEAKYPGSEINSCLVNKYSGPDAFLPRHSDNEQNIAPGSNIFTVSLGCSDTIKFSEIHGAACMSQTVENNSLYVMTRTSQAFWQHQTSKDSGRANDDVRYSLTFRNVSDKFRRSTVIIGDSNTRHLKFGTGRGTFGHQIPGKRIEATHISKINPVDCCGYKNIFIHCGVNDIKHFRVNTMDKISKKSQELQTVINEIVAICPNSNVYVSPILPTKSMDINRRAIKFNEMLFRFRSECGTFECLDFTVFVDKYGCLRPDLGRHWNPQDSLHLGVNGISIMVNMIRKRVYSTVISSFRPYKKFSSVLQGNGVNRAGSGHRAVMSSQFDVAAT